MQRASAQGVWVSRWTFVAAATGLAIGLGNFWRFPHEVGTNGGLPYILLYLVFVAAIAMPVMMAEVVLGSRGRANPETSVQFLNLEAGNHSAWRLLPILAITTGLVILVHLSIVSGWALNYSYYLGDSKLQAVSIEFAGEFFSDYVQSKEDMLKGFTGFLMVLTPLAMMRMTRLTGQILRLLVPLIIIMLISLLYAADRMGDMKASLEWMFGIRPEDFGFAAVRSALGQAFYTLGIGTGALMIYGAYFPDGRSISRQVAAVALIDTLAALAAGLSIYALVLGHNIEPGNSVALMFISLPFAFGGHIFGDMIGSMFFALIGCVMLCSALALIEPATSWLEEKTPLPRWLAVVLLVVLVWIAGYGVILDLLTSESAGWLSMLNRLSADVMLPVSALGLAIYVGWFMREVQARDELHYCQPLTFWIWWRLLRYISPPAILAVLVLSVAQWG